MMLIATCVGPFLVAITAAGRPKNVHGVISGQLALATLTHWKTSPKHWVQRTALRKGLARGVPDKTRIGLLRDSLPLFKKASQRQTSASAPKRRTAEITDIGSR